MNIRLVIAVMTVAAALSACGSPAPPPAPPITVVAVGPAAQAITLSTGDKYWDTDLDLAVDDTAGDDRAACVAEFDRAYTKRALVGRTLQSFKWIPTWTSAPAGYPPAEVEYTGPSSRIEGDDILGADGIPTQREAACPRKTYEEPATGGTTPEPSDTNVNVDVDNDDDKSRFCRRHWYC